MESDYTESSKALEITALKKLLLDWKDFDLFNGFCHDLDSSARTMIENIGLKLKEYFDQNHAVKHFNGVSKLYPKKLKGIQGKLKIHFSTCVHMKTQKKNDTQKKRKGCFSHFTVV